MAVITPVAAATVTLVRDGEAGLEVLMLRRNLESVFVAGQYVFPGGSVDAADSAPGIYARCKGLDDAVASRRLGVADHGLAFWIAALRETFEEAGLLLARKSNGESVTRAEALALACHRDDVAKGEHPFESLLADEGLTLCAEDMVYFSHWITPAGAPRRYDTRFFVALAPDQEPAHDNGETIANVWVRPPEGVEQFREGKLKMMTPTIHTLRLFAQFETAGALIDAMRALPNVPTIAPRIGKDGRRIMPGEAGYEEAGAHEGTVKWR
jgi:8-oxo-dGTP pyrophosphatase MutT (NUDIX family)